MAVWTISGIGGNTSAIAGLTGNTAIQNLSLTVPADFDGTAVTQVAISNAGTTTDQGSDDTLLLSRFDFQVNGTNMSILAMFNAKL